MLPTSRRAHRQVLFCLLLAACSTSDATEERSLTPEQIEEARRTIQLKGERLRDEGPKPTDRPNEAAQYFLDQRLAPGMDRLPIEHLLEESRRLQQRQLEQIEVAGTSGALGWQNLGPGNIGGRTRALVIDPNQPDTMFAAGVAGGVWKTTDGGENWNLTDDFMLNLAVCSLAMDPNDSNVLYAGTGEGYFFSSAFVTGFGIFKSTDAGESWTHLSGTTTGVPAGAFDYVNKVVISPNNSNRVYAATRTGVWRSIDAGQSWNVVLSNPNYINTPPTTSGCLVGCTELVVRDDRNPDVLFACFGSAQADGFYRSEDGGSSWLAYSVPSNQGRMTLALAPSNQDILYLLMADNGSGGALGKLVNVYRSTDGGDSFTGQVDFDSLAGPWILSNLSLATGCLTGFDVYSQGWYDNIIAVDPTSPDSVWVGGVDLFRSDDGGENFKLAGYWFFGNVDDPPTSFIHADQHEIVFHPDYDGLFNQQMFVTNDGGLWRTDNALGFTSLEDCPLPADEPEPEIVWESLNNGYGVTQFYHGDSAKSEPIYAGGCQDNGTNLVSSNTTPDDWQKIFGGDGGYVAIDPRDSQTIYAEIQFFPEIRKSTDGGQTFQLAVDGITDTNGGFIAPFAMDQDNPDVLWCGSSRPWRTTNGATLWEAAGPNFVGSNRISAIAIAPSDSNVVYMGLETGYVVRTTNALAPSPTWQVFANGLYGAWVSSIGVDPEDPNRAYATYSTYGVPHVVRTVNGGNSWAPLEGSGANTLPDVPAHWIEARPCDGSELYVATELGVFWSDDSGANWYPTGQGFPNVKVESLDFQDENTLVAFTHGRGVFRTALAPCPGGYKDVPLISKP